jgi:tRNA pseudouridine55 synthase
LKKCGEGFLIIDKPSGVSSFAVVTAVRRRFGGVKAGHAGTLDPAASGLLVLALGKTTRLLPFLPLEPKRYCFGVRFGTMTDTLDADGSVVESGRPLPSAAELETVLPRFCGMLSQVPPEFSAVRVGGVRAYSLARQGLRVELAPRRIEVFSLRMMQYDPAAGEAFFDVSCSGGTYVRSLARDIAGALGTCGYASSVRRIAAGKFHVDGALAFDRLDRAEEALLPVHEILQGLPQLEVNEEQKGKIAQGSDIICEAPHDTVFAFDDGNNIQAVLKRKGDGRYHPVRVFI